MYVTHTHYFPTTSAGYNWTMCGEPTWFCNMSQSCGAKLNPDKFVPGLKVADWKAIDTVSVP